MRWVKVAFCLFWPGIVTAQDIAISTGWHSGFSRVVISIQPQEDWSVGRTNDGYALRLAQGSFDLDGFFDRLPRDRITAAEQRDSGLLDLTIACDCHADAFLFRADRLVVDIKDGPAPDNSPFEQALAGGAEPQEFALLPFSLPDPPTLEEISPLQSMEDDQPDLSELEQNVLAGLTRAAEQGLITFDGVLPDAAAPPPATPSRVITDLGKPIWQQEGFALPITPGIKARTSKDFAGLEGLVTDLNAVGQVCWPDDHFDVAQWGHPDGFAAGVGQYRGDVYAEFDRVNSDAVLALARHFVHFGFGREAIQTLQIDGLMSQERLALRAVAEIIDDEPLSSADLAGQISCPGDVALWSLLADPSADLDRTTEPLRLVRQFRALPLALQQHLAPRLSREFAANDPDAAELVLSPALDSDAPGPEGTAVLADIAADRGATQEAIEKLSTLVAEDRRARPQDVIRLTSLLLAEGELIPPDLISLLSSMRFEYRADPIHDEILAAEIRALIAGDAFVRASNLVVETPIGSDLKNLLQEELAVAAIGNAPDVFFLDLAFATDHGALPPNAQNAMGQRLIDLGFPDRAEFILRYDTVQDDMRDRRYLRAEAAIALGDAERAAKILTGIDTERATRILAGTQTADDDSDALTAWRSGDWARLATGDDPLLQAASSLRLQPRDLTPDPQAPLAQGRALVSEAGAVRQTMGDLLTRFSGPTSP